MILSDRSIKESVASGRIVITPYDESLVQPASIDIRLDGRFLVFRNYKHSCIDPKSPQDDLTEMVTVQEGDPFIVHPGEFILGNTVERVKLGNDLVARLEGKALALDTAVPTPTGWTTMGRLKPGDQVFGGSGEPCQVTAVSPIYLGNVCHSLVFDDRTTVVADASHRWVTWTTKERSRENKFNKRVTDGLAVRLLPAPSIKTTADIAETLQHRTPAYMECNHAIDVAALETTDTPLPIDPYVLGAWLGDGTTTEATITIGLEDQAHFHHEFIKRGYPLGSRSVETVFSISNVGQRRNAKGQFCDNGSFKCQLRSLGVLGDKHIPMPYLRASFCQRLELLRGLMDTDGCCSRRGQAELCLCNKRLADDATELIASLGIKVWQIASPAALYGRVVGTRYRIRFEAAMQVFAMERKSARVPLPAARKGETKRRFIKSADKVESVAVRCIEVDSSDSQFLVTRSFIPTHNSSLGRLGLIVHATAGYVDPGFDGNITLELSNVANLPIRLYPGMKVGQISFFAMTTAADRPYGSPGLGSKYKGQTAPTASKMHLNFPNGEEKTAR